MALNVGRKGFIGVGLQTGFQAPAVISDYVPFMSNELHGVQEQIKIEHATGNRDVTLSSVPGKRYGEGDIELLLDEKMAGYFLVGAMGSVSVTNVGSGVYKHTITRNNSNTPQYLTITNDRVVDRQFYPDVTVDEVELSVATELASLKAKLSSSYPTTTASGTNTTASGNIFSFRNASFAFGTTVSGAQSATNLKPHDLKVTVKNNVDVIHRHGSADAASISAKGFDVDAEMTLYFENTTDRDYYYNQTKQAASIGFIGAGIGGGFNAALYLNFYQVSFSEFTLETGLDNFYAEKVKLNAEYDTVNQKSLDMVLYNNKSLYI